MRQQYFLELKREQEPGMAPATLVAGWNGLALAALATARTPPGAAAQSLAILHTCMYNAWAAYDDTARQTPNGFAVRLPCAERNAANKACAMGHAAFLALTARFPAGRAAIDAHCARLGLDPGPAGVLSPAGIGRTQASCMLDAYREIVPAEGNAIPSPAHWCRLAHAMSARAVHDDDRDVLLYFVLSNALSDAAAVAGLERAGAAAAEALRRFMGNSSGYDQAIAGAVADEWGNSIGAHAFERARRYWEGRP